MVRLAGKLQRPQKFMSGTNFYFCHVINTRYAMSEKQYGDIVKFFTIQLAVGYISRSEGKKNEGYGGDRSRS